jgi:Arc/MetJ-type ribon-helix-helix transcriptional regulator
MKISVSLSDEDVAFLDEYAKALKMSSRSAVLQRAVRLLKASGLAPAYADAWKEWEESGEAAEWESVVGDGLGVRNK